MPSNRPRIAPYLHHIPTIHPSAYVDEDAVVIGDVEIGARASIWPGVILRGDQGGIHIGEESNVQDGTVAHATGGMSTVHIGRRCTVGHRVVLHGCRVEDDCLIGMGAILLDNCVVEANCVIGAGALILADTRIPARSLVVGSPARVVRTLTDAEISRHIRRGHGEYMRLSQEYGADHG